MCEVYLTYPLTRPCVPLWVHLPVDQNCCYQVSIQITSQCLSITVLKESEHLQWMLLHYKMYLKK